ncbi:MAG: CBS domain-containing protein [Acidobacteriota bacterium]|nr:CBS domain-containing protein [Acidobacteriota bacterium]
MKQIAELIEGQTLTVIDPNINVRSAAQTMTDRNIGAVAVVDAGRLAGIFSERDLLSRVVAKGLDPDDTTVGVVMSKELVVADKRDDVDTALEKMQAIHARHLPVVDDGQLVGMISLRDLLEVNDRDHRARATFLKELVTYSPDYDS